MIEISTGWAAAIGIAAACIALYLIAKVSDWKGRAKFYRARLEDVFVLDPTLATALEADNGEYNLEGLPRIMRVPGVRERISLARLERLAKDRRTLHKRSISEDDLATFKRILEEARK